MKRTELETLAAGKVVTRMKRSAPPERYAQGSASVPDRREQRRVGQSKTRISKSETNSKSK